jgi:hypothetical protein
MNGGRVDRVRAVNPRQSEGHRAAATSRLEGRPDLGVPLGRTKSHHDVLRSDQSVEPGPVFHRNIERRQGPLADDDRVHELDGDMLSVGGIWSAAEGEQPPAAQEARRHFTACFGQADGLTRKKAAGDLIA